VNGKLDRRWQLERWIAWARLAAVPWAVLEVGVFTESYPSGAYQAAAWVTTAALALGAAAFFWLTRREAEPRVQRATALTALAFDAAIVWAYTVVYAFQPGTPIRQLLFFPVVEAALRFGLVGGVVTPLAQAPVLVAIEAWRADRFSPPDFTFDHVTFALGLQLGMGAVVGWLVSRLGREAQVAETRAAEAEGLRDSLGRRVDLLDAAGRCARALSSSLDIEQAFAAFIRELGGLVAFDRTAIVLAEDGSARVIAAAGAGAGTALAPGTRLAVTDTVMEDILASAQPIYRADISKPLYPEEEEFLALGLRCRLAVPLLAGAQAIGMISLARADPASFEDEEVELVSLLGRFMGSAVQNIHAYEAERATVLELRRLSALRADFISLVSHELRSPMAAVIGSAKTLRQRWRELNPDQRESFLALIEHETDRLANLVGDVLDTSRIESGSFSYSFIDLDLGDLVQESATAAESAQDEVRIRSTVLRPLPPVRADRDRLRQVIANLLENAVKYSPAGGEVEIHTYADNGRINVEVRDHGPGIASEHQSLIFERFGRVRGEHAKPGTGLGLYIARSIAEAHGGSLEVHSVPEQGATFTLALPAEGESSL
jgi:signal transduction histidine kinase